MVNDKQDTRKLAERRDNSISITVIDAAMGSGKTTWAIDYINKTNERIMYVTPFLDEISRVQEACSGKGLYDPQNKGTTKTQRVLDLLDNKENIATTHELFKRLTAENIRAIEEGEYTLIIDEAVEVVKQFEDVRKNDLDTLLAAGLASLDDDGFIVWNSDKADFDTKYNTVKNLAMNRGLVVIDGKAWLWQYPPEIFRAFKKVYILTYLFDASVLRCYFDLYGIGYEKKSLDEHGSLCEFHESDTSAYRNLVNIYSGKKMNAVASKVSALSKKWFERSYNREKMKELKRNTYNYFHNIVQANCKSILWTVYGDYETKMQGAGYTYTGRKYIDDNGKLKREKCFLACNSRGTNKYRDRYNLAYLVNRYMHPEVIKFFAQRGITVHQDLWALSEMLQWIWRSRIRDGEPINIYIPSARMRNLLRQWLAGKAHELAA